mmetsp:Transcript_4693/g.17488  ORF Transcript_4693/g.17488 Transcript_4693/m.17488 type:complete len:229 (-) Transcript_4693:1205-1891(-)
MDLVIGLSFPPPFVPAFCDPRGARLRSSRSFSSAAASFASRSLAPRSSSASALRSITCASTVPFNDATSLSRALNDPARECNRDSISSSAARSGRICVSRASTSSRRNRLVSVSAATRVASEASNSARSASTCPIASSTRASRPLAVSSRDAARALAASAAARALAASIASRSTRSASASPSTLARLRALAGRTGSYRLRRESGHATSSSVRHGGLFVSGDLSAASAR